MLNLKQSANRGKLLANWTALLLFCWAVAANAALPDGIDVTLQPLQANYDKGEQVMIKVTYHNVTSQTIKILAWDTALSGRVDEDFLTIQHDGYVLPYSGRHYKRRPPTAADYVSINPGGNVSAVIDLSTGYTLSYRGDYLIAPKFSSTHLPRTKSSPVTIRLTADRPIELKQTPIVSNCIGSRPSQINSALGSAESLARRARDDMQNTPVSERGNARRYREWFGDYQESRWNKVQSNFNRIYDAASNRTITFICDDSASAAGVFAYVYPSDPYKVYLGGVFWLVPQTGSDSKAGTIIHELSHFIVVADTDDVVYGQSGARSLARSNPSSAIRNADSHEYFAENTPNLPMPTEVTPIPAPEPEPEPKPIIVQILNLLLFND